MSLHGNLKPLQNNEAFASLKLVDDYIERGRLPTIHDPMGVTMDWVPADQRTGVLDLGACHGLLSVRASLMGWRKVVGVEIDEESVRVFNAYLKHLVTGVTLEAGGINVFDRAFPAWLAGMAARGLDTILARRIFCEIFVDTFGKREGRKPENYRAAARLFAQAARDAGFKRIILEGRIWKGYVKQKRHHPLYFVDREIEVLAPLWRCIYRHEDCAVMVPFEECPNPLPTRASPF